MADLLGTSISGLLAYQRALKTTSHNISNVNTPGFSRQRVELGTQVPDFQGGSYIGNGTVVQGVRRVYDQFLTEQVRDLTSSRQQEDTLHQLASQLDNILADPQAGLSPVMERFFSAVQDLADDPASTAARQVVLGQAESLAVRFNSFAGRLDNLYGGINTQLNTAVDEINGLAASIAEVNRDILNLQGSGDITSAPNDLLDRRDELIRQLSEYTSVSTVAQDDGTLNVFVGTGQSLVVGVESQRLGLASDPYDPVRQQIGYVTGSGTVDITSQLTGGKLGGVLAFREQVLDPAYNRLGQVATGLVETLNAQHRLGQDLDGEMGGDLFTIGAPEVLSRSSNTGSADVDVAVADTASLTLSDYRLDFDGADYTVTRLNDGTTSTFGALAPPGVSVDGLQISLTSGAMNNGDSFLIRPTRQGAESIDVAITDPRKLAAAAPIRTASDISNVGAATVSAGTVNAPPVDANLRETVTITFNDPPGTFNVSGTGTGDPVNVAYTPGEDITYNGWTVQISGTPASGDRFTVQRNTDGSGDNRNALLLGALQATRTLDQGDSTFGDAYGNLVTSVGVRTERAQAASESQGVLLDQAVASRENVSGVNLDEEAANLLRFQQAYQAAAQAITVANTLFESILGAVRR